MPSWRERIQNRGVQQRHLDLFQFNFGVLIGICCMTIVHQTLYQLIALSDAENSENNDATQDNSQGFRDDVTNVTRTSALLTGALNKGNKNIYSNRTISRKDKVEDWDWMDVHTIKNVKVKESKKQQQ